MMIYMTDIQTNSPMDAQLYVSAKINGSSSIFLLAKILKKKKTFCSYTVTLSTAIYFMDGVASIS